MGTDYNFTYNQNEITDLTGNSNSNYFIPTGGISAGIGGNAQAHAVGHQHLHSMFTNRFTTKMARLLKALL